MYFSYNLEEWLHDWGEMGEATHTIETDNYPEWVRNFFHSRHANPLEADWKLERQRKARAYLERHSDVFETGSWVIASTQSVMVGGPLVLALFQFFSHATDEEVLREPPPEIMIKVAEEYHRRGC